uniref:Uncharacterized protein n=1 Tax=Arundo donax TaxID=35708 RepID=A0A0A8XNT3_ARUDO
MTLSGHALSVAPLIPAVRSVRVTALLAYAAAQCSCFLLL